MSDFSKVILAPCGKDQKGNIGWFNYSSTILNKVKTKDITKYDKNFKSDKEHFSVWGFKSKQGEKINIGDIIIFYSLKQFISYGVIKHKFKSDKFQSKFWRSNGDSEIWDTIIIIEKFSENITLDILSYNKILGYKENYYIQGATFLNKEKSLLLIYNLNKNNFLIEYSIEKLDKNSYEETDKITTTKARIEQNNLRDTLLKNSNKGLCVICKKEFPKELLWASHLEKRKNLSNAERREYEKIAGLMCLMGCDKLYEQGYIVINKEGYIVRNTYKDMIDVIDKYIVSFENTKPSNWNFETKEYFDKRTNSILDI